VGPFYFGTVLLSTPQIQTKHLLFIVRGGIYIHNNNFLLC
jgi:hypothetical protein